MLPAAYFWGGLERSLVSRQGVELPPASPGDLCSHGAVGSKEQTWKKTTKKGKKKFISAEQMSGILCSLPPLSLLLLPSQGCS